MRKFGLILISVVVVAGIALFRPLSTKSRNNGPCNILLITMDTTRADRVGCYGYAAARTPTLDELAGKGVLFERAYSHVPLTLPSHTTIHTGLLPPEHGLRNNGKRRLNSAVPTLAEIFHEHEYRTGAFIAAPVLDAKYGLERGFDRYDDDMTDAFTYGGQLVAKGYRMANQVVDSALAWLKEPADNPFFCWVHLFDPHLPYQPHGASAGTSFTHEALYDAEIAFADAQIQRLMAYLRSRRIEKRTLVVVVGDHGESLGEHGENTHGLMLYNATMRIPLIIAQPGSISAGRRISNVVGAVDLFVTLLDWVGIQNETETSGRSLVPALKGETINTIPTYGETEHAYTEFRWCPQQCLITEHWKYIRSPRPELYDLKTDPNELHNLAASRQDILRELETQLAEREDAMIHHSAETVRLSAREKQQLQAIGYVGEGDARDLEARDLSSLRDVKDVKAVIAMVGRIRWDLKGKVSLEERVKMRREMVRLSPESPLLHRKLGEAVMELGKLDEAEKSLREAVRIDPSVTMARCSLALCLMRQSKFDEANNELSQALQHDPQYAEGHRLLGVGLANVGRLDEAVKHLREAIRLQPDSPAIHGWFVSLGEVLTQTGNLAGAAEQYRQAIERKPNYAEAKAKLAAVLSKLGDKQGAITRFRQAVQTDPTAVEARVGLARVLAATGQIDEAKHVLRDGLDIAPNSVPLLRALGNLAINSKAWPQAAEFFKQVVSDPESQWTDHYSLGVTLTRLNRDTQAIEAFDQATRLDDGNKGAYLKVGIFWTEEGKYERAMKTLQEGLKKRPDQLNLLNSLAWLRATCPKAEIRNGTEAVRLARRVLKTTGDKNPNVLDTLAAALAETGRFDEAAETAEKAHKIARERNAQELTRNIEQRLALYRAGKAYRDAKPEN